MPVFWRQCLFVLQGFCREAVWSRALWLPLANTPQSNGKAPLTCEHQDRSDSASHSAFSWHVSGFIHSGKFPQLYLNSPDLHIFEDCGKLFHGMTLSLDLYNFFSWILGISQCIISRDTWCWFFLLVMILTLIT